MDNKIKVAVAGCFGRMGRLLIQEILTSDDFCLAGGSIKFGSNYENVDIGEFIVNKPIGLKATSKPQEFFENADCVIDFSQPEALSTHLELAAQYQTPLVIAVTNLSQEHKKHIEEASSHCPLLYASNTSLGITLLLNLVEQAARTLPDSFDIDIIESHHRHKKDAPSGTSLALGQAVHQGKNSYQDYFYNLPSSDPRPEGTIGYGVIRSGGFPGDHRVIFASEGEVIELKHRSFNRQIYAQGALKAARWLIHKPPGLYSMKDVLAL